VTRQLGDLERNTVSFFSSLSEEDQEAYCGTRNGFSGLSAWDIQQFKPSIYGNEFPLGCATGDCKDTVWIAGKCQSSHEVNYYFFGITTRLCNDYKKQKRKVDIYTLLWDHKNGNSPECKKAWFNAGYHANLGGVSCGEKPLCKPCGKRFANLSGIWRKPGGFLYWGTDWEPIVATGR